MAPKFNPAPDEWEKPWLGFITDYPASLGTAAGGYEALERFWLPILEDILLGLLCGSRKLGSGSMDEEDRLDSNGSVTSSSCGEMMPDKS
jgi:hypothetical protein